MAHAAVAADSFASGLGGSWTNGISPFSALATGTGIVLPSAVGPACVAGYSGASFAARQYSAIVSAGLAAGDSAIGPIVNWQGGASAACYIGIVYALNGGGAKYTIARYDAAGTRTNLAFGPETGGALSAGVVVELESDNGRLSLISNESGQRVVRVTTYDATLTGGSPGVYAYSAVSATSAQVDAWEGGNLSTDAVSPAVIKQLRRMIGTGSGGR